MRTRHLFIAAAVALSLIGCHKKREPNKIVEGLPLHVEESVIPAQAVQVYLLVHQAMLNIVVPVVNRSSIETSTYEELTGPDARMRYRFNASDSRYGTAHFTLQFLDENNAPIDPLSNAASTSTLASVDVTATGSGPLFPSYSMNVVVRITIVGTVTSDKTMAGTFDIDGSGYSMNFRITGTGAPVSFLGFIGGSVSATGSGGSPNAPVALTLTFNSSHEGDGTLRWDSQTGGIHMDTTGQGFVTTEQARIFIY